MLCDLMSEPLVSGWARDNLNDTDPINSGDAMLVIFHKLSGILGKIKAKTSQKILLNGDNFEEVYEDMSS